jgi:hypothetical protein
MLSVLYKQRYSNKTKAGSAILVLQIAVVDFNWYVLDFKLLPCLVFSVLSFGCFPGVWFILADVSEHSVPSSRQMISKTSKSSALKMEQIDCSGTSANINQTPGKHPKDSTLKTGMFLTNAQVVHFIALQTICVNKYTY